MAQRSPLRPNGTRNDAAALDRLSAALDASCVVGSWDWDIQRNTMVYDSGAARLLTGDASLAHVELTGLQTIAAVHPADHQWLIDHVQRAIEVGGLFVAEYRVVDQDGAIRWLLSRGRTYQDPIGRPVRSRGIIIDITETRDESERYYLHRYPAQQVAPLEQAAEFALASKKALDKTAPDEVRIALDRLLLALGFALARPGRRL